jgi:hypothetical protein
MKADKSFLDAFVSRFKLDVQDDWLAAHMQELRIEALDKDADPAMLLRALHVDFERIYYPTGESLRVAKWIYMIARGFVAHRYQSATEYVDVCMCRVDGTNHFRLPDACRFSPDSVPIYAIDGLPGAGKSALFRALQRAFPQPQVLSVEGNPPQRIGTVSALWVSASANFSVREWMRNTLADLGIDLSKYKGLRTIEALMPLMFKTLFRTGVGVIVVDELQFASGLTSARRVLSQLLSMREFGVPIVFFANSDLLANIQRAPAQVSQRVPHDKQTLLPLLRGDPAFRQILALQLGLVPFGHDINLRAEAGNIYDMVAGSPRAIAKLIEIAAATSIPQRRKFTILDLVEAKRSCGFDAMRKHISLLTSTAPVDAERYPELASNNDQFDEARAYERQMNEQRIQDAAALNLYGALSERQREAAHAAEIEILRNAGKIPQNVAAVGESKKQRKRKSDSDKTLRNSYAARRVAAFPPKNPTSRR